jgi:F-type H+-transporting ATPase subunit b
MSNFTGWLLAAEEGTEPSGLDLILPETAELIWATLAFAVVAVVLMKVAWPKIRGAVEAREAEIAGNLQSAESSKTEAQQTLDEYKAQLADARSESNRIIEEARQSAEQVRKDMIAKAEAEAAAIVERAGEQIANERNRTLEELRGEVGRLAVDLAERVVGNSLDRQAQSKLVDDYISQVGGMNGNTSN